MLTSLSIRNIVLIDELHLDFEKGLCVLTGETGAGKSILLEALGLALGERAETRLLRQGTKKAEVIACFSLYSSHLIGRELKELGLPFEDPELIFRRHLDDEGKSKCFLNDHPISQTLMRRLGQQLVGIHGQFDQLLEAKSHAEALDAYGKVDKTPVEDAFKAYQGAKADLETFREKQTQFFERQTFLSFAIEEIEKAAPNPGEEEVLEKEKALIAHRAKIAEALSLVNQSLAPVFTGLAQSHKALSRVLDHLPGQIHPLIEATDRAIVETQEIFEGMKSLTRDVEGTQYDLENLENRLYELRSLSRKYKTADLFTCLSEYKQELVTLEQGENHIDELEKTLDSLKEAYLKEAQILSETRTKVALSLETALSKEFPPLKLEHAKFRVHFKKLSEKAWGPSGQDHMEFYIQMNPGSPEGPLSAIASGGELSRLMLALKVILTQSGGISTLIFDEIESGTGGAVAAAMGERLKNLSHHLQLFAITHSPQIAAQGTQHFVVLKFVQDETTTTHVRALKPEERGEEVARMLSAQEITDEARAAARRLMKGL